MEIYEFRKSVIDSEIMFYNKLSCEEYQKKYFPQIPGESVSEYRRRPKISAPITSAIIERIVSFTLKDLQVTIENDEELTNYLNNTFNIFEKTRDMLIQALVTGNTALLYKLDENGQFITEQWTGEYINVFRNAIILEYLAEADEDGNIEIEPILENPTREEQKHIKQIVIDDLIFSNVSHNLPFAPYTLLQSTDRNRELILLGNPFPLRFMQLVIEYNKTLSKMSKDIQIMSNVWVTNKNAENPDKPIRLDSGVINYLGENGTLTQAIKELDLTEERNFLSLLKENISEVSQVPSQLIGLENIGKIPSGIALQLMFQPLIELVKRIRQSTTFAIKDMAMKSIYFNNRQLIDKNSIIVNYSNSIIPSDKESELKVLEVGIQSGIFTSDEISTKIKGMLL